MIRARQGAGIVGGIYECSPRVGHKPPKSPAAAPASIMATPARVTASPRRRRSWEPGRGKLQAMLLGCSAEADRILLIINNNSMSATADSRLAALSRFVIAVQSGERALRPTHFLCEADSMPIALHPPDGGHGVAHPPHKPALW